jgi:indolepyruvate ferredoxin oxidoreductase
MSTTTPIRREVTLTDRYTAESGPVMLSGVQALVRLMLDVRRLDERRGYDTGVFITGYQGSPLVGLDQELARAQRFLEPAGVVFHPGLNEELAATAVGGTQLLGEIDGRTKQGVTGFWYGKNPGFDRAADAIRHASFSGTAPLGGAVALIGDDPTSKSSSLPSSCESACRSQVMPVLAPGTVGEILSLGLHAVAISRHAGMWTGLKIVADLADAAVVVEAGEALGSIPKFAPRESHQPPVLLPPTNLAAEQDLFTNRLARVHEYAAVAHLNRIEFEPQLPRVGIVASGMGYQSVLRALERLGIGGDELEALGLRLVKISMPWPIEPSALRELVRGLETVLVVEDKLPFVEAQLKEALYRESAAPLVLGKQDCEGRPLLPVGGSVSADDVADALVRVLPDESLTSGVRAHLRSARTDLGLSLELGEPFTKRTPYFCSGCPHNVSTRADADELVGVGIGCHTMVTLDRPDRRGHLIGIPQMGGEGAHWFGLAPFVSEEHFIQNMGDGTFHHSGSLAIRAAVAAGVNMTFRLLYNDAVAMTGGQQPEGQLAVPELAALLALEGVRRVVITTPEPERYRGVKLDPIAEVRHRDDFEHVQSELTAVPGVTVLIHDDRCATEKRRLRKRGLLETPAERVWINERVCEGCGDCGEQSSCLSLQPIETEFGRKTRVHQSSCNQDTSCLKGDCPSFVVVKSKPRRGSESKVLPPISSPGIELPDPVMRVPNDVLIRMPGVGGTGVVTTAAVLRMAALLQGRHAAGLDQTGLAQKGGPVLSDLRIASAPIEGQIRAGNGSVDLLLGFDLLGCVDAATLATLDRDRTVAVLNSNVTPTAENVTDVTVGLPVSARLIGHVRQATRSSDAIALTAEALSESLFGDHMQANMLLVGAAFQHGCLPLEAEAIERAIELNGAAVDKNVAAFRWGRAAIADPAALDEALGRGGAGAPPLAPPTEPVALADLLDRYRSELIAYQDVSYACRYLDDVLSLASLEHERLGDDSSKITRAYAAGLFKLMAYKDEYEVARLHLDAVEQARMHAEFGGDVKVQVLLHPPALRALGLKRKLRLGRSAPLLFKTLRLGRRVRGTSLDPFGRAEVRRLERALIGEYREMVRSALERVEASNVDTVLAIAELPDMVRGYEAVKLASVGRMRARAGELMRRLDQPERVGPVELNLVISR